MPAPRQYVRLQREKKKRILLQLPLESRTVLFGILQPVLLDRLQIYPVVFARI